MLKKTTVMVLAALCCVIGFQTAAFAAASLSLNQTTFNPGEEMFITVSGIDESLLDYAPYVGVYIAGGVEDDFDDMDYVSENNEVLELYAPDTLGSYELRLYRDNEDASAAVLLHRLPFTVAYHSAGNLTAALDKVYFDLDEDIIIDVRGYNDTMFDRNPFLGLYLAGAANDDYESDWPITEDAKEETFYAPDEPGIYEIRLIFEDDETYTVISTTKISVGGVPLPADPSNPNPPAPPSPAAQQPSEPEPQPGQQPPASAPVTALTATKITESGLQSGIKLEWPAFAAAAGYKVYRSETSGVYDLPLNEEILYSNGFVDVNIESGKTYYYTVKSAAPQGTEPASEEAISQTGSAVVRKTAGAKAHYILMKIDSPMMSVDGKIVEVDPGRGTSPIVTADNRTIVPIRAIVEAMNGTVLWSDADKKTTLIGKSTAVDMWIGKTAFKVNGADKIMEVSPQIINERTMIPLRYAAEALDSIVNWLSATREILIVFE